MIMTDGFTPDDRKMLIETHTKMCFIEKIHTKKLDDHEERIREGEGFRNRVLGWAVGAGITTAAAAEAIKAKFFGM